MKRVLLCLASLSLGLLATGGCGLSWSTVKDTTETPGAVKVFLQTHDDEDFRFGVTNESQQPITVLADSIKLVGPRKSVSREVGAPFMGVGAFVESVSQGSSPQVAPGQSITVFAHFNLDDADIKKGDQVRIDFMGAILQAGQPIPVDPLLFTTR